jgi:preprotein translocase subunit SecG
MKDVQSKWLVFLWFIIIMYLAELALTKNKSKQSSEIRIKTSTQLLNQSLLKTVGANTN